MRVEASQRDEYPQVLTRIDVTHESKGRWSGGRRPTRDRAVGDEVLPGQRDALGRRDRGPPRLSVMRCTGASRSTRPPARSSSPGRTAGPTSSPDGPPPRPRRPRQQRPPPTSCMTMRSAMYSHTVMAAVHHDLVPVLARTARAGDAERARERGDRDRRPIATDRRPEPADAASASASSAPPAMSAQSSSGSWTGTPSSHRRPAGTRPRRGGRRDPPPPVAHRLTASTPHLPDADAVFLALPHGTAAALVPDLVAGGTAVIDLGPDFRLRNPRDYPRWYGFEHPAPGAPGEGRLRPAGAAPRRAGGPRGRRDADRRRARLLSRRPPSWRWRPSPAPVSSATSSSTPRAASPAPVAIPSPS